MSLRQLGPVYDGLGIAAGQYPGINHVNKFGAITSVGTSFEDVWHYGGTWVPMAAASVLDVSSDDVNDTLLGTGAQTLTVQGLDANYLEIEETVDLDGTTPVQTIAEFLRVNRAFVASAGTTAASNTGNLFIADDVTAHTDGVPDTASAVQVQIVAGEGQSQVCRYTVPANKTGYLSSVYVLAGDNKTVTFEFYRYTPTLVRRIIFSGTVTDINFTKDYDPLNVIPAQTTILCRAKVEVGTALVAAGFDVVQREDV